MNIWLWIAALIVALAALLYLGVHLRPSRFAAPAAGPRPLGTSPVPGGLPAPVERFFQTALGGDGAPVIASAILSGRGSLRISGIRFPARYRFTHQAGQGYRHYIEATVFGRPLFRVNEWYLGGHCRMELPVGVIANDPKSDMGANLALWGESVFLAPIFLTDARVRWEAVDATHARLVVPSGTGTDTFDVTFDAATGLILSLEALRWKAPASPAKTPWRIDLGAWQRFGDVLVPTTWALTWGDEKDAWFAASVEDVVYNADVAEYIKATGP